MIWVTRPTPISTLTHLPKTSPAPISLHLQPPNGSNPEKKQSKELKLPSNKTHVLKPILSPTQKKPSPKLSGGSHAAEGGTGRMWALCGFGYWVQGFRCFPWLGLNFHLAHGLGLSPAELQLVQHAGNLPLVAKPVFGLLSDAVYIGGAHRVPYISIGGWCSVLCR